jgi:hypothetical protein
MTITHDYDYPYGNDELGDWDEVVSKKPPADEKTVED